MYPDPSSFENETDRIVVGLPEELFEYGFPTYIGLALRSVGPHEPVFKVLGNGDRLPYLQSYRLVAALCGDWAQRVVDAKLRVSGEFVTPEGYLRYWRTAIAAAVPLHALARTRNIQLLASIKSNALALLSGRKSENGPVVRAFLSDYADAIDMKPNGNFVMRHSDLAADGFATRLAQLVTCFPYEESEVRTHSVVVCARWIETARTPVLARSRLALEEEA